MFMPVICVLISLLCVTNHMIHMLIANIHARYTSTQCFFARLGFVQPPSCLKCAYRLSRCGSTNSGVSNQKNNNHCNADKETSDGRRDGGGGEASTDSASIPMTPKSCGELVAWRVDANIPLHPDNLEGNIVFITCDTAKSLVSGDAYPSVRWEIRNKRLLH